MNEKEINEAFDREYEIHSKDPVYRIIRACGSSTANSDINVFALEKIIADIKAAEREACAKLCEDQIKSYMSKQYTTDPLGGYRERFASEQCAAAIRGRTEPKSDFKNQMDDNWSGII
jgi:hypothetical protein